jgi:equilibrative nucleoside transporter 1/2/3
MALLFKTKQTKKENSHTKEMSNISSVIQQEQQTIDNYHYQEDGIYDYYTNNDDDDDDDDNDENEDNEEDDDVAVVRKSSLTNSGLLFIDPRIKKNKSIPIDDNYNLAYVLFMILGVGSILCGHCFILAIDFFRDIYPEYKDDLEHVLSFSYNAGQIVGILAVVFFCPATQSEAVDMLKKRSGLKSSLFLSIRERIYLFQWINFICMCLVCCINLIIMLEFGEHGMKSQNFGKVVAFYATMFLNAITGIASGILVASLFGLAAIFPWDYTQSAMGGLALAGAIASAVRIGTKYYLTSRLLSTITEENILFFGLAAAWNLLCVIAFAVLLRLPITKYCVRRSLTLTSLQSESFDGNNSNDEREFIFRNPTLYESIDDIPENNSLSINQLDAHTNSDIDSTKVIEFQKQRSRAAWWFSVWRKLLSVGWGVFFTFTITFSVTPGVISEIEPTGELMKDENWYSIFNLSCFAISDCIGRFLPRWKRTVLLNYRQLWVLIVLRSLFIVAIILCVKPRVIYGDVWVTIIVIFFGVSHGYCASLAMMIGPTLAAPEEAELSAVVMTLYLNSGLFVGSAIGLSIGVLFNL